MSGNDSAQGNRHRGPERRDAGRHADARLADPLKFTTIAHADHQYLSPLSEAKAAALVCNLDLPAGGEVLDIGCGPARLLLEIVAAYPVHGVGVDMNAAYVARAQAAAKAEGLADRVTLIAKRLVDAVRPSGRLAGIIAMGSSQAIGTPREALAWIHRALAPGRVALFADGYWKAPPPPDYLEALGARADELGTHADNAALARATGFRVLTTTTANDDEWDEYEGRYCRAVERYVDAHPDDPDSAAMAERICRWHDAYLRWGRASLGFGYYVLLKPAAR
jgi:SAM-dependent methyltransferase